MKRVLFLLVTIFLGLHVLDAENVNKTVSLIPYPVEMFAGEGSFVFTKDTEIAIESTTMEPMAKEFIALFEKAAGFAPKLKVESKKGDVCLKLDSKIQEEGYVMEVKPNKIMIKASGVKGSFYALQTLRQLLPPAIEGEKVSKEVNWSVPAITVKDEPRFGYRGLMLDVARYFLPKEYLLKVIDCMGMLKLNKLHLHLTDDNGWRVEIKRYPLLTEVGSRRVERPGQVFSERRNARQGEPTKEGGYYTQEDIKEIVAYAANRQIEVIPEIAMPRHVNAALAAYPLLACPVIEKYIGVIPGLGGDRTGYTFCVGNDDVYTFVQDVIDEIVEMFPSKYIHLGGDAIRNTHWEECPLCLKRMQKEGVKGEKGLLGYFMRRIDSYVRSKQRQVMGWEEIMDANLSKGVVVFDWHGYGHGAVKAGKQGHHFVVTPSRSMYLNSYQGPQWKEPVLSFGGGILLKDVYSYEPIERYWTMSMRTMLLGVQASLWTEFCEKPEDVDFLLFPRLGAVAEAAWSFPIAKKWERFLGTLDDYELRWLEKGIIPSRSMYNVQHEVTPNYGSLKVVLTCERPDVEIRYTTDGSEPQPYSELYRRPWLVKESQTVKCVTFKEGKQMGETLFIPIKMNGVTGRNVLRSNPVERRVVNGVRGSLKNTDGEWASWSNNDSITLTFDVGSRKLLKRVLLGYLNDVGQAIHKPEKVEVWLSNNDVSYWKTMERQYEAEEIFREGRFTEDLEFNFEDTGRYVRLVIKGAEKCPERHVRPNMGPRIYIDEVLIE